MAVHRVDDDSNPWRHVVRCLVRMEDNGESDEDERIFIYTVCCLSRVNAITVG